MVQILLNLLCFILLILAVFLILLILIQRGKGGGLAGAFGGMGGQSAFGTKAGDTFTRITIGVASVWIILCFFTVWLANNALSGGNKSRIQIEQPAEEPKAEQPADENQTAQPAEPAEQE